MILISKKPVIKQNQSKEGEKGTKKMSEIIFSLENKCSHFHKQTMT